MIRSVSRLVPGLVALMVSTGCAATTNSVETRTVSTELGEVEVPAVIESVVVLEGRRDLDIVLALGLPLAGYPYEGPETGIELTLPIEPELARARDAGAEQLFLAGEIDIEAIAAAEPTIIVSRIDDVEPILSELRAIAPVIPVSSHDAGVTWQDDLVLVAEATGTEARAQEIIAEFDARFAEVKTARADAIATIPVAAVGYDVEGTEVESTRLQSVLMRDLGAKPSEAFAEAIARGPQGFSPEQTLNAYQDAGAILLLADTDEEWAAAQVDPLVQLLPAFQSGALVRGDKMTHEGGPITATHTLGLIDQMYSQAV